MTLTLTPELVQGIALKPPAIEGKITNVLGLLAEGSAPMAAVGDMVRIQSRRGPVLAEVVALKNGGAIMIPFGDLHGLAIGDAILPAGETSNIPVGEALKGHVIDALGRPLDGRPLAVMKESRYIHSAPLPPLARSPIEDRLPLGVRALDTFTPCGRGQRLGIFAGAGVGKSVLLGSIARATSADVTVLALVGERGREVGHFVHNILGPETLKKTVVVVATSDRPPNERVRAAYVATTIAEYFRDSGQSVLLFVDSLTRFCMAQREIGLAVGEPPTTKGYPSSAFGMLPRLLERAAPRLSGGSVTGIYTVLVEGDDMNEPVADAARGLLDGHITLSRDLAARGHYPAIDIGHSLSRLESELVQEPERGFVRVVRRWLALMDEAHDLIAVGAYQKGANPELDTALERRDAIESFLRQDISEISGPQETYASLRRLVEEAQL